MHPLTRRGRARKAALDAHAQGLILIGDIGYDSTASWLPAYATTLRDTLGPQSQEQFMRQVRHAVHAATSAADGFRQDGLNLARNGYTPNGSHTAASHEKAAALYIAANRRLRAAKSLLDSLQHQVALLQKDCEEAANRARKLQFTLGHLCLVIPGDALEAEMTTSGLQQLRTLAAAAEVLIGDRELLLAALVLNVAESFLVTIEQLCAMGGTPPPGVTR